MHTLTEIIEIGQRRQERLPTAIDLDNVRRELDRRAAEIDDKIAQLEAAQRVSRETMELEFTI